MTVSAVDETDRNRHTDTRSIWALVFLYWRINPMLRKKLGIDFVCGKNYNSNKPSENQILVKLQRVNARMTWLGEAMKDGVSTDMPRGAANWL